jgi:hypothetical protein
MVCHCVLRTGIRFFAAACCGYRSQWLALVMPLLHQRYERAASDWVSARLVNLSSGAFFTWATGTDLDSLDSQNVETTAEAFLRQKYGGVARLLW